MVVVEAMRVAQGILFRMSDTPIEKKGKSVEKRDAMVTIKGIVIHTRELRYLSDRFIVVPRQFSHVVKDRTLPKSIAHFLLNY
jgi:hypothetical protein